MGSLELLDGGTTTVLDHAHCTWSNETADASLNATFDSGVRGYWAFTVHATGWTWEDQTTKLKAIAREDRFHGGNSVMNVGLAWDYFFDAPQKNVSELWHIVKDYHLSIVTTHFLGGPWSATNSPELLSGYGWLNDTVPIVFSHASFIGFEDAKLLRQTDQYISTTAESEMHYGHNHPWARLVQDHAALGVDTHFTYSSSMVQQARLWLQSLRWPNYLEALDEWIIPVNNPMTVEQVYLLITRAGGQALRRPDLGVIQVGAKADLVVYRTDGPNMVGWSDPVAAIVLHSDVGDIEDVLVNGKFVKRGGKLLHHDLDGVKRRFARSAKRIQEIWAQTEWPAITGYFFSGAGGLEGHAPDIHT